MPSTEVSLYSGCAQARSNCTLLLASFTVDKLAILLTDEIAKPTPKMNLLHKKFTQRHTQHVMNLPMNNAKMKE